MGSSANAECESCGYSRVNLTVGGGRSNHRTFASWPVLCRSCEEVSTANMKATPPECRKCGSADIVAYGDPSITNQLPEEDMESDYWVRPIIQWDDMELREGSNLCPKCGKWDLKFSEGWLLWD